MTQEIIDIGDAPNDGTGDPVRDAFNKCNNNFTELYAADAAGGGAATTTSVPPQGRLTLQTGTPVMTSTQAAKTTLFYPPYAGDQIGLYNGTSMVMTTFTELSVATTDTTKSPAAIGASKVNDWFVWNDAGTIRLGHGPDWTSDTARSAGTALVMVNGIWLNNASITNGPAASRGTYVGTTRSNASSQLDWIFGSNATNGVAGFFSVWNCYNRVDVASQSTVDATSWTVPANTLVSAAYLPNANNATGMRASAIFGLSEEPARAHYNVTGSGGNALVGIGVDNTVMIGRIGASAAYGPTGAMDERIVPLGFHFWTALEGAGGSVSSFYSGGTGNGAAVFSWHARM